MNPPLSDLAVILVIVGIFCGALGVGSIIAELLPFDWPQRRRR